MDNPPYSSRSAHDCVDGRRGPPPTSRGASAVGNPEIAQEEADFLGAGADPLVIIRHLNASGDGWLERVPKDPQRSRRGDENQAFERAGGGAGVDALGDALQKAAFGGVRGRVVVDIVPPVTEPVEHGTAGSAGPMSIVLVGEKRPGIKLSEPAVTPAFG